MLHSIIFFLVDNLVMDVKGVGALGGIRSRGSVLLPISRVDGVTGHHPGPLNDQGVFVVSGHLNLPDAD